MGPQEWDQGRSQRAESRRAPSPHHVGAPGKDSHGEPGDGSHQTADLLGLDLGLPDSREGGNESAAHRPPS